MARPKGSKNKSKKHPSDRPELLEKQIELNQLENPLIKITLKCLGRVFESSGETFEEALGKLKISGGARAISTIFVEKGDYKKSRILNARQTSALFGGGSPSLRAIHLKGIKNIIGL